MAADKRSLACFCTPSQHQIITHPTGRRYRPGWRWGPLCWGWRAGCRPRRCTTWRCPRGRSCTPGWSACWCWSGPAAHRRRWRWASRRQSGPAATSLRGESGSTPCCLGRDRICQGGRLGSLVLRQLTCADNKGQGMYIIYSSSQNGNGGWAQDHGSWEGWRCDDWGCNMHKYWDQRSKSPSATFLTKTLWNFLIILTFSLNLIFLLWLKSRFKIFLTLPWEISGGETLNPSKYFNWIYSFPTKFKLFRLKNIKIHLQNPKPH